MSKKWVYLFTEVADAEKYVGGKWDDVRALLGGKGANLFEMTRIGLPVPPGFTVTTEACNAYLANGGKFPEGMWEQELEALKATEKATGKTFGDPKNPLLVSCRSGAKESMPGMMDTVLNIGLNDVTVEGLAKLTENPRFAWDAYRRLIEGFGKVVLEIPDTAFEHALQRHEAEARRPAGHRAEHRGPEGSDRAVQGDRAAAQGLRLPPGPDRAAAPGHRGRLQELERQARRRLPPPREHPRHAGHRGQHRDHGLRQHGQHLRHRRRVHPQPEHRREEGLRRVPDQRPGRGRRRRHPHARRRSTVMEKDLPEAYAEFMRHLRAAREALQEHAGCRVHDRARQALDAPDP